MIYGIVASAVEFFITGSSPPVGPSPNGEMDFVNGTYSWGVTTLTAADVTDKTAWIGASGLAVPGSAAAGASILYAPLTTLLATCDFSAVFEVETLYNSAADILTVSNSYEAYYTSLTVYGGVEWALSDYGGITRSASDGAHGLTLGIHKISFTQRMAGLSVSVDGNAVETDTTDISGAPMPVGGFPMVRFHLGGWTTYTDAAINIRSMSFYDALEDTDLPALSA